MDKNGRFDPYVGMPPEEGDGWDDGMLSPDKAKRFAEWLSEVRYSPDQPRNDEEASLGVVTASPTKRLPRWRRR